MTVGEFSAVHVVRSGQRVAEINGFANLLLGGGGQAGDFWLKTATGTDAVSMNSSNASLVLGAAGLAGQILVNGTGGQVFLVSGRTGDMFLGGQGQAGDLKIKNASNIQTIHLNGATGRASYSGGDCAEDFTVLDDRSVDPGTVLVIDDSGSLCPSEEPYDRRVAGIVSGAGGIGPGIVLGHEESKPDTMPLALTGKVFCKVDTAEGAIRVGDLLTSSSTRGHAMAASDPTRAFGAVIGKALRPWNDGIGLIPVLVSLQ
jgi:hypothetical protein